MRIALRQWPRILASTLCLSLESYYPSNNQQHERQQEVGQVQAMGWGENGWGSQDERLG